MSFIGNIGIDLGTTCSCVACCLNGTIEIIANDSGSRITPSYVAFTDCERLIGEVAKDQIEVNPENTIFDAKRLIGRKFYEATVQKDIKHWPFKVINDRGDPRIEISYKGEKKLFSPEEISAMVLAKMKETAESYLNQNVENAVITVPAYFNDSQRQATKDAGAIAGLNVLRIINEPSAAAIAYGLHTKIDEEKTVLIFDLGGGTFDVAIMNIEKNKFTVKAIGGDGHLGGEDFDKNMMKYFIEEIKKKHNVDITSNKCTVQRLKNCCERAKKLLSTAIKASFDLVLTDGIHYSGSITRTRFDDLNMDLFRSTIETVTEALEDAKMSKGDIDDVVLVGGSTRIPKIQYLLQQFFDGKKLNKSINPDEAVAYGAAVQANILERNEYDDFSDVVILDVTSLSLGIATKGNVMDFLIPRNTPIPTTASRIYGTSRDFQTKVNIQVYEGERLSTKKNHLLGNFVVKDIPAELRSVSKIKIIFDIDGDGILTVTAIDLATSNKNKIVVANQKGRLTDEEIGNMIKEAAKFKLEDLKRKKDTDAKIDLDILYYNLTFAMDSNESNKQLSFENKKEILDYSNKIKEDLNSIDLHDEEHYKTFKAGLEQLIEKFKIHM